MASMRIPRIKVPLPKLKSPKIVSPKIPQPDKASILKSDLLTKMITNPYNAYQIKRKGQ